MKKLFIIIFVLSPIMALSQKYLEFDTILLYQFDKNNTTSATVSIPDSFVYKISNVEVSLFFNANYFGGVSLSIDPTGGTSLNKSIRLYYSKNDAYGVPSIYKAELPYVIPAGSTFKLSHNGYPHYSFITIIVYKVIKL